MPEVGGKKYSYTKKGMAAAAKAKKAMAAGAKMGAMAGKGAVDRKMLKKAGNRDAVTKKKMGYGG
tara:strand:+ start:9140 stop:9334 length:195 start_codon:yes stop_codon:yes gene_type:complete